MFSFRFDGIDISKKTKIIKRFIFLHPIYYIIYVVPVNPLLNIINVEDSYLLEILIRSIKILIPFSEFCFYDLFFLKMNTGFNIPLVFL